MLLLNVPFAQKDEAKALGARWDKDQKKWYVPDHVDPLPFLERAEWTDPDYVAPPPPPQVPGHGPKWPLYVDLVPKSAWFRNLRKALTDEEWTAARKKTAKAADYVCQICLCKGPKWPVEAHERWSFDEDSGVQTLTGIEALCPACHEVTHFGFARVRGREAEATAHLMAVNGWTEAEVKKHVREAMDVYVRRSAMEWQIDARWLLTFIELSEETTETILGQADGMGARTLTPDEQAILDADAAAEQIDSSVLYGDPFEVPS